MLPTPDISFVTDTREKPLDLKPGMLNSYLSELAVWTSNDRISKQLVKTGPVLRPLGETLAELKQY